MEWKQWRTCRQQNGVSTSVRHRMDSEGWRFRSRIPDEVFRPRSCHDYSTRSLQPMKMEWVSALLSHVPLSTPIRDAFLRKTIRIAARHSDLTFQSAMT